jgi:hypothetical protein
LVIEAHNDHPDFRFLNYFTFPGLEVLSMSFYDTSNRKPHPMAISSLHTLIETSSRSLQLFKLYAEPFLVDDLDVILTMPGLEEIPCVQLSCIPGSSNNEQEILRRMGTLKNGKELELMRFTYVCIGGAICSRVAR